MRRQLIMLPLIWCILSALAFGQTLAIQVPAQSEPYTLIDAAATPGHNSYLWTIEDPQREETSQWRQTSPDCDRICFTGRPGKYRLTVIVTTGECKLLKATASAVIEEALPPDPLPPPSELAAVVIVEESSRRTKEHATVWADRTWRRYLDGCKIKWAWRDPDVKDEMVSAPPDLLPSLNAAKTTLGPDVCFVFADGSVHCMPLPESPEAMLELLRRIGGE